MHPRMEESWIVETSAIEMLRKEMLNEIHTLRLSV